MILHFDFSTGASGNKVLGALLEVSERLGTADFADLQRLAEALVPETHIERQHLRQGGIQATGITVEEHDAPVRHWHEIRALIEDAGASGALSAGAAALALEAFGAIARAEAAVHDRDIEHVHFHEVGAADSIIDICCSSFLMDRLAPEAVYATPLALGSGTFVCAHGELPVPAPATARLIEGLPVYASSHEGELTTPTGATLARSFVSAWEPLPCMRPQVVGYGAGSRVIPGASNTVRVLAGERVGLAGLQAAPQAAGAAAGQAESQAAGAAAESQAAGASAAPQAAGASATPQAAGTKDAALVLEGCTLLEANIDHLSPEALAFACEELLAAGALDVWQESITMKKGRLAIRLCVLASADTTQRLAERVITLTGSLGVRSTYVERVRTTREIVARETRHGKVAFKTAFVATPDGRVRLQRPEYEDVARIAREQGLDFNTLYEELAAGVHEDA
jgi:uncharacterized protein (TIGR00299 family) protein